MATQTGVVAQITTQYQVFTVGFSGLAVSASATADNGYQLFNTANATLLNYPFFLAS